MVAEARPRVTVAIPVYNRQRYVGQAIESILAQDFADFEVLVVDDGSTDDTREVVRSYRDPRVRLTCHSANQGVARTRNDAVELARGEYVAFLDSDDWAFPGRLRKQVSFLDRHPDHVAVGAWIDWMDESGRGFGKIKQKPIDPDEIAAERLFRSGIENSASMARTAILKEYRHDETYEIGSDFDLWARLAARHKLANLPEVLVRRRAHPQRTTREKSACIASLRKAIYASQLTQLGVRFTDEDLEFHYLLRRMHKLRFAPDRRYLAWADKWLRGLQEANRINRCYPEPQFSRVLGAVWLATCWRAAPGLGLIACRAFLGSPLRRSAWAGARAVSLRRVRGRFVRP